MKKHSVVSKFKNPDKFIKKLRDQLKWALESVEYFKGEASRLRGKRWFTYTEETTKNAVLSLNNIERHKPRLNQEVVMVGRIVGYKQDGDDHVVTMSITRVALKGEDGE